MNVYLYVALVTLVGLVSAYFLGRLMTDRSGVAAFFLSIVVSVGLGVFLAFPVGLTIIDVCSTFGIREKDCIRTDDRTVWYLWIPLVFFPGYMVCMLAARAIGRQRAAHGKQSGA